MRSRPVAGGLCRIRIPRIREKRDGWGTKGNACRVGIYMMAWKTCWAGELGLVSITWFSDQGRVKSFFFLLRV